MWYLVVYCALSVYSQLSVISGFRRDVVEIRSLLGHYLASNGHSTLSNVPEESRSPQSTSLLCSVDGLAIHYELGGPGVECR